MLILTLMFRVTAFVTQFSSNTAFWMKYQYMPAKKKFKPDSWMSFFSPLRNVTFGMAQWAKANT